jgi:catechol 2,3-dioxygenase
MNEFKLPPTTATAAVALTIIDLNRSLDFYQSVLGLKLHHQNQVHATLGSGEVDLLHLEANPGALKPQKTTGLYHFAIRAPSRHDLAFVMQRIAESETPVSGFADHNVSEAIYLTDPDGNGIEIYRDRPRETWYHPDGRLRMGTDPLDVGKLMRELDHADQSWDGLPAGTRLGHVHLHVSDLESGINFYRDALGLDLMMRYGPSAAFLSAGGYHHHVGINTWNGTDAPPPPQDSVGLRFFTVQLPDQGSLEELRKHLKRREVPFESNGAGIWARDPSGNRILLTSSSA